MMRLPGLLSAVFLWTFAWTLVGTDPAAAQTNRPRVTDVRFEGNRVFDDDDLQSAIVNRPSGCRSWTLTFFCWAGVDAARDDRFLAPSEFPLDALRLQAYYWLRGYREAQVDTASVPGDGVVELEFTITEGAPVLVESLDVFGLEELNVPGVAVDLPLEVGDPLSAIRIQAVKDTLRSRLREVGYAYSEVYSGFFIPKDAQVAELSFDVAPGPQSTFGPVTVEWPGADAGVSGKELDETTIRRLVPFREGGTYRASQLVEGQRNLYSLDLIRNARVEVFRDTVTLDPVIPVRVQIVEGDAHRVRAGAGWSTADCLNSEAEWASRNFQGGARRLTVRARISNILAPQFNTTALCEQVGTGEFAQLNGQISAELFQPFFLSTRNSLTLNTFLERQSVRDIFVREALGFALTFSRNVGRQARLSVGYQPTLASLRAGEVVFCVSFLLCTQDDISVFEDLNWLSPITLGFGLDRSNRFLNPTAGYSLSVEFEHASGYTGSDFDYNRAVGQVAAYAGLGESTVLAARVRAGVVRPGVYELRGVERNLSHPQKRFYAGGASSVRGFGENRLGPRVLYVRSVRTLLDTRRAADGSLAPFCLPAELAAGTCAPAGLGAGFVEVRPTGGDATLEGNLELRFPLVGQSFQGAIFVDVGQVWTRDAQRTLAIDLSDLEFTPGLGFRYLSPIGPIRVDLGYRFQGAENLPVLTPGLAPCVVADGCPVTSQLSVIGGDGETLQRIPWQATPDLQRLDSPLAFGGGQSLWDRVQLHFSIGQPF
jgi:outer membrane protein insertion porin family/translocation and assembly module TamA